MSKQNSKPRSGLWGKVIGVGVVFLVGLILGAAGKVSFEGEQTCTPPAAVERVITGE
jgi:hypothetical protein